jgi:putative flippase GtrA
LNLRIVNHQLLTSEEMSALTSYITALKTRHNVKIKFVFVGIFNFISSYFLFLLLLWFFADFLGVRLGYLYAVVVGYIVSTIISFIFHKYVTFESKQKGKAIILEFFRFCLTYIFTLLLSLVLMPIFVEVFHIDPKFAALINLSIVSLVNYTGHSKFSFKV